ncbi:hypothetical protein NY78_1128 [Desulfovibrio sp. TomC]|nr:hypothetical protein NY78_1128 [Desulfovibrio sp. TomC]
MYKKIRLPKTQAPGGLARPPKSPGSPGLTEISIDFEGLHCREQNGRLAESGP